MAQVCGVHRPFFRTIAAAQVGISLDWRVYEDMGHSACDEELDDVASWIADRIA